MHDTLQKEENASIILQSAALLSLGGGAVKQRRKAKLYKMTSQLIDGDPR